MAELLLIADFGTQSVRVGVIDQRGGLRAEHSTPYPTHYPRPGWAEQSPATWVDGFKHSLGTILDQLTSRERAAIRSMSISATSSTVVPINRDGSARGNALLWMDNRSSRYSQQINETGHEILASCGGAVSAEWLVPKVLWNKYENRSWYDDTFKFVEQLDYLNMFLTGELASSQCNATCKANYSDGWSSDFFKRIGLEDFREKMCTDVIAVGAQVGLLRPELSSEFGLPSGIRVYQGCIDAYAGMIGLGAVREGIMATIMGTSFVELCLSPTESRPDGIWGPYKDALIPGTYIYEGGQVAGGSIIKWFRSLIGGISYDVLSEEAEAVGVGSNGLLVLDFFQGNRTPYKEPRLKGQIQGLTLSHTRGDLYRSLMEGVAFGTRNVIETMKAADIPIVEFVASGGVTKDPLWLSIIASVCGVPISITSSSAYAGLLGSAMIASLSSGIYASYEEAAERMIETERIVEPNRDQGEAYGLLFDRYLSECSNLLERVQG